jgi:predicted CoA-binding protein
MANTLIESCKKILERSSSILLIDWPDQRVPCSLLKAGLIVYGFSPNHYTIGRLETDGSQNAEGMNLVFTKINKPPDLIDIVCIYRPEEEHASLITNHVLPLHAKVIWLQPPVTSIKTRDLAKEYGITFIEGVDITEIV